MAFLSVRCKLLNNSVLIFLDVNEPPTAINVNLYEAEVVENKPNVDVGAVTVEDPDTDRKYSCAVSDKNRAASHLFTVVEVDKKIVLKTINKGLDFEVNHDHSVVVYVSCRDAQYSIERSFRIHIKGLHLTLFFCCC